MMSLVHEKKNKVAAVGSTKEKSSGDKSSVGAGPGGKKGSGSGSGGEYSHAPRSAVSSFRAKNLNHVSGAKSADNKKIGTLKEIHA